MFSFFYTIFQKITYVVTSIAITVGLVSAPVPQSITEISPPIIQETQTPTEQPTVPITPTPSSSSKAEKKSTVNISTTQKSHEPLTPSVATEKIKAVEPTDAVPAPTAQNVLQDIPTPKKDLLVQNIKNSGTVLESSSIDFWPVGSFEIQIDEAYEPLYVSKVEYETNIKSAIQIKIDGGMYIPCTNGVCTPTTEVTAQGKIFTFRVKPASTTGEYTIRIKKIELVSTNPTTFYYVANLPTTLPNFTFAISAPPTPQIVKDLVVTVDKTIVQLGLEDPIVRISYTENGEIMPMSFTFSTSDGTTRKLIYNSDPANGCPSDASCIGGPCPSNCVFSPTFHPTSLGKKTITVSGGGFTKTVDVTVVPWVKVDSEIQDIVRGQTIPSVGNFKLSAADEVTKVDWITYDTNLPKYQIPNRPDLAGMSPYVYFYSDGQEIGSNSYPSTSHNIYIRVNQQNINDIPIGTYTLTIKDIKLIGQASGQYRYVTGLPVTFTFEVK